MQLAWFGTASLAVRTSRASLLIDPFVPLPGSAVPVAPQHFDGCADVLITHAHIDHVSSLPHLCLRQPRRVYGTAAVQAAMQAIHVRQAEFHELQPGAALRLGDLDAAVFRSRHIRFDRSLVLHTLFSRRILRYAANLPHIVPTHRRCRELNETVGYLLQADEKRVFVLGSLNLHPDVSYPTDMDLLVLPYQGASCLIQPAMAVIERLRPKAVLLDHFDDTFPPLSSAISTDDIEQALSGVLPVIKPDYGVWYTV